MGQEDHDMVTQQVFDPAILIILCNMFFISNTTYSQNPNNTDTPIIRRKIGIVSLSIIVDDLLCASLK